MTNEEILAQYGPRESMEYDVVVVAVALPVCPPPSASSNWLLKTGKDVSVVVLEKGSEPGAHPVGRHHGPQGPGRADPRLEGSTRRPLNQPVTDDAYIFLSKRARVPNPLLPLCTNHGNYIVSLGAVTKWLADRLKPWAWKSSPASRPLKCCTTMTARCKGVATGNMGIRQGRRAHRQLPARHGTAGQVHRVCRRRTRPPGQAN